MTYRVMRSMNMPNRKSAPKMSTALHEFTMARTRSNTGWNLMP